MLGGAHFNGPIGPDLTRCPSLARENLELEIGKPQPDRRISQSLTEVKALPPQGVRSDCVLVAKPLPIRACSFGERLISPQGSIKRKELE